ncbi:MAG: hypothetical protein L6W00_17595 [Lentisphaeria bacterium]|nr:MAG: hypothetical protein L6W00_17595 [Lentisphaeria bacterium]
MEILEKLLKLSALLHQPMMREKADTLAWAFLLELLEFRRNDIRRGERFRKFQEIVSSLQLHYLTSPDIARLAHLHGLSERSFLPLLELLQQRIADRLHQPPETGIRQEQSDLHRHDRLRNRGEAGIQHDLFRPVLQTADRDDPRPLPEGVRRKIFAAVSEETVP